MKISRESLIFFLYGKDEIEPREESIPALPSVPSDILLGRSMIPGAVFGVFARQHISKGLVVGPLIMNPKFGLMRAGSPSYPEEQLIHDSWAWLKYIQPARHPFEENARVETSEDGLYFRVTHDIPPGSEILAWMSDPALRLFGLEVPEDRKQQNSPCSSNDSPVSSPNAQQFDNQETHHTAICRICGKTCATYVELWAHVTTFHTAHFGNQATPLPQRSTMYSYPSQSTLPNTSLSMRSPLSTRPYPTSSPRHTTLSPKTSGDDISPVPSSDFYSTDDVLPLSECRDTERPYECGHCGKSFSLPSSLRRHIITHTGERPYKCGYCGRAFAGATTLNNHIRIHTGEKPHVCHDCGAGFTQATQLNRHIRCCSKTTKEMNTSEIFVS